MTVTEVVHFTLKPGTDVTTVGAEDNQIVDHVLETIMKQDGCLSLAHGATIENHEDLDMIVDLSDIKDHHNFIASDIYGPFKERAVSLITGQLGSLTINHVHFSSSIGEVTDKSPVVEMLLLYVSPSHGDEVPGTLTRFLDILAANAKGFVATTHGWVVEELDKEGVEGKLKGYFVAIGWESVEAHMAYRETEAFKESIPLVRALAKGLRLHHTSFTKYEKS